MLTRQQDWGTMSFPAMFPWGQTALQDLIAQDLNLVQLVHSEHLLYTRPALGFVQHPSHNCSGSVQCQEVGDFILQQKGSRHFRIPPLPSPHLSPSLGI